MPALLRSFRWFAACLAAQGLLLLAARQAASAPGLKFEADIRPILSAHCWGCHGADKQEGKLDLRTMTAIARGGESGPTITWGRPAESRLLEKIIQGEMPPEDGKKLTAQQVAVLQRWIEAGPPAETPPGLDAQNPAGGDENFWAFQKLHWPQVPQVANMERVRTPIDRFLLEKLEAGGLSFSPDADRSTLLRRVCLDLTGLPPTPDEVARFLTDDAPNPYERLVDRLLESPAFGERWGRHWLDVVGYVDTVGFDTDATNIIVSENKWRYRDYVIAAWNQDKPYDRFLLEQIAGDELVDWRHADHYTPEMVECLVATGFLRTARDETHEPESNIPLSHFGVLHDTMEIVGGSVLGLTLNCARCHNHKFDPITQDDYYRLMAIFTPAYNPQNWKPVFPWKAEIQDRTLPDVPPTERTAIDRHNAALDAQETILKEQRSALHQSYRRRLRDSKLNLLPEAIRGDTRAALEAPPAERNEVQKYLAQKFEKTLDVNQEEILAALDEQDRATKARREQELAGLRAQHRTFGKLQCLFDVGPPPDTHLLLRGSFENPGPVVQPGFPRALCSPDAPTTLDPVPSAAETSGRRTTLARWLTMPDTPAAGLVSRVLVNRLWQHLFGVGLVPTVENLGLSGQPPTHPELLEWLASDFVAGGWRIKPLMRGMLLSTAYRQASAPHVDEQSREAMRLGQTSVDPEQVDPGDDLLWRMRLRRLESETIRDCLLATSGQLDLTPGGPPVPIEALPDGRVVVAEKKLSRPTDRARRSVYLLSRRAYNVSLLTVFDQPLVATTCPRRDNSAVALQSLTMLNDAFLTEQAEQFASRVATTALASGADEIETAFRIALLRSPNEAERAICRQLLHQQAEIFRAAGDTAADSDRKSLVQLCLTLLNTTEFLYVQ